MTEKTGPAVNNHEMKEDEVRYFVIGFRRILHRYRFMAMLGWVAVLAGIVSVYLGWQLGMPHGLIDLSLSCLTILSGVLVVQQAIAALQEYVSMPFPRPQQPAAVEIRELMDEIQRGGWREATGAIGKLRIILATHGIPDDRAADSSQLFQER